MATPNDKRIHWFLGTNKIGQPMRMCNRYVSGFFVPTNHADNKHLVTCSKCKAAFKDPKKMAKLVDYHVRYRALWG